MFQENAILDWYVYLTDIFRLRMEKVKDMLSAKLQPAIFMEVILYMRLIRFNISLGTKKIDYIDLAETDDDEIVKAASLLVVLTKLAPVLLELVEKEKKMHTQVNNSKLPNVHLNQRFLRHFHEKYRQPLRSCLHEILKHISVQRKNSYRYHLCFTYHCSYDAIVFEFRTGLVSIRSSAKFRNFNMI